ncbi:mechanosensitive ion channel family protein [Rickettsiales bacterium]|nr:mechanosensitive ion channel family protein [Rickettsiales bacterium]
MLENFLDVIGLSKDSSWVLQIFIVIFISQIVAFFVNRFIKKVNDKLSRTKNLWDDALVTALRLPVKVLIWVIGLSFAVEIIYDQSNMEIFKAIYPIRDVSVIACISWFVIRFIRESQKNIIHKSQQGEKEVDRTTLDAIGTILRATVIITSGLIMLQTLGYSISGVLAFGGVGGIAIGFAAKDLLANFFGAMMIYFDQPFKVGDWIRSADRDIEGVVQEIGWRQTRIETFERRPLYVPNSLFSTISVENPSRMTHRKISEVIGVRYDDINKVEKITDQVRKMVTEHPDIDKNLSIVVSLDKFNASSVDFIFSAFTTVTDRIEFTKLKQELLLAIAKIIDKNKAEIAFPTSTLHIPDGVAVKTN